jgi:hypothetical protein
LPAKLKQDLREGTVRLEQILATGADYLTTAEVFDLLVTVPKIGPVTADHLLTIARISPSKTVGTLSGRQRPPHRAAQPLARANAQGSFRNTGPSDDLLARQLYIEAHPRRWRPSPRRSADARRERGSRHMLDEREVVPAEVGG